MRAEQHAGVPSDSPQRGGRCAEGHMDYTVKQLFDIEGGVDIGLVISYLRHLDEMGALLISVKDIKVGKVFYSIERGLEFVNDETGEREAVDKAFINSKTRAIIGTYSPKHVRAMRRNTDYSWTEVDSMKPGQSVHPDLAVKLQEMIKEQVDRARGDRHIKIALPSVFL